MCAHRHSGSPPRCSRCKGRLFAGAMMLACSAPSLWHLATCPVLSAAAQPTGRSREYAAHGCWQSWRPGQLLSQVSRASWRAVIRSREPRQSGQAGAALRHARPAPLLSRGAHGRGDRKHSGDGNDGQRLSRHGRRVLRFSRVTRLSDWRTWPPLDAPPRAFASVASFSSMTTRRR